ncbi:MAG: hypothetical protein JWO41_619 [Candidatus Saccharibacteria bacterium]|nr:hypothetical protein [Candidatus Saccharibacteria bacterium]
MPHHFELIQGDKDNPVYNQQVDVFLAEKDSFNNQDKELVSDFSWDYTDRLAEEQWFDPMYAPVWAVDRWEQAWDLANQGKQLCLAGIVRVMGGTSPILYTPYSAMGWRDYGHSQYETESLDAYVPKTELKRRGKLYLVS